MTCPEHLLSWDKADAQESWRESLSLRAAQLSTVSRLQCVPEAGQYIDSGEIALVMVTGDTSSQGSQSWMSLPQSPW